MFEFHPQLLIAPDNDAHKIANGNLYLQQHAVIELVEVAPPPPRPISSVICSESSYCSSDSDDYEEETDASEDEQESVCESYCSSDLSPEHMDAPCASRTEADALSSKMMRIMHWRENFDAASVCLSDSPVHKRKVAEIESLFDEADSFSHSSKRSRSSYSTSSRRSISSAELEMYPCPACDAFFPTEQSLRQHGRDGANEACWVAVEYAFEQ